MLLKLPNKSLQRSLVARDVLSVLRTEIITQSLKPGEHLKEMQLSTRFGVSRGPVQVALQQLEREGLVQVHSNGRTFVVGISDKDLEDMYDLRLYLEKQAVMILLAQEYVDFSPLFSAMNGLRKEGRKGEDADPVHMASLGYHVHVALMRCSMNRAITNAWETIASIMYTIMEINGNYVKASDTLNAHELLVNTIVQKRPDAIDVIENHLLRSSKDVYKDALSQIVSAGKCT